MIRIAVRASTTCAKKQVDGGERAELRVNLRKRVLLVGNDVPWVASLALKLAQDQHTDVLVARSRPAAMAIAAEYQPEVALLGASFVREHGMTVRDAIATVSPNTRVIITKDA
jgi:ActR/RegA family two-component response regulator